LDFLTKIFEQHKGKDLTYQQFLDILTFDLDNEVKKMVDNFQENLAKAVDYLFKDS